MPDRVEPSTRRELFHRMSGVTAAVGRDECMSTAEWREEAQSDPIWDKPML